MGVQGGGLVRARKRNLSGQALEQDAAEGVAIAGCRRRIALDLLRGDVIDRAQELAGARQRGVVGRLDQPEIGEVGVVALTDQDVLRLDVAVDQAGGVRLVERLGDLGKDPQRAAGIQLARRIRSFSVGPSIRRMARNSPCSAWPAS